MKPPHHSTTINNSSLTKPHISEIQTIFRAYNPNLSGYIDVKTFETMCHSLGFRADSTKINNCLDDILKKEDANENFNPPRKERNTNYQIDLSMAIHLLTQMGYAHRNADDEMKMYFRSLDVGNKGYVSLEDLRRLQIDAKEFERTYASIKNHDTPSDPDVVQEHDRAGVVVSVGESSLQAMIDQFDINHDGVIDYDEFRYILSPIIPLQGKNETA